MRVTQHSMVLIEEIDISAFKASTVHTIYRRLLLTLVVPKQISKHGNFRSRNVTGRKTGRTQTCRNVTKPIMLH